MEILNLLKTPHDVWAWLTTDKEPAEPSSTMRAGMLVSPKPQTLNPKPQTLNL